MQIPEESYLTGLWEVDAAEEFEAKETARAYHANRSVCLAKQKRLPIWRFCFVVMLVPLFCYFCDEFFQKDLSSYMAVISIVYTLPALYFVLFRKNLRIPAIGSLVFLAEVFRLNDWSAIVPTWIPILLLNGIAYFYDRDRKWLEMQPGFPEFHDIAVRVRAHALQTKRDVPPPSAPEDDPYGDILSPLHHG